MSKTKRTHRWETEREFPNRDRLGMYKVVSVETPSYSGTRTYWEATGNYLDKAIAHELRRQAGERTTK